MSASYRSNIAINHRCPLAGDERLLVFESDFSSYHLAFVRAGIERYFERGARSVAYLQMGMADLLELLGPSVRQRLVIVGAIRSRKAIEYFAESGIPCLNLIESEQGPSAQFDVRIEGEGTVAARYFIEEAKCEHLGFIGLTHAISHRRRFREFFNEAALRRVEVHAIRLLTSDTQKHFWDVPEVQWSGYHDEVRLFLERLPKPAGIFCANDGIALRVFYLAEMMGIRVPKELAILGIGSRDNAKLQWAHVVSVVQLDHQALGYAAARLMDEYIATGKAPKSVRLPPRGISHSQTTYRRTVADPLVSKALMTIQRNPGIDVLALCEEFDLPRAALDLRFRRVTNMTVAKAIEVERFTLAKDFIRRKGYSLETVASLAGYPNRRGMRRSFYRFTRMSPQQFRDLDTGSE